MAYLGSNSSQVHGRSGWSKKNVTSGQLCSTLTNRSKAMKSHPYDKPEVLACFYLFLEAR